MAQQGNAVKPAHIDNAFAGTQSEIYANQPFYGALFRVQNGQEVYLQYVEQKDRLTLSSFLDQKNISQGQFLIKMNGENGTLKEIPIMVDKNGDSSATNPFFQNMPGQMSPQDPAQTAVKDRLEAEIIRLKGELDTVKSKRDDAEEKLYKYKRENSDETGQLKNEHRTKLDNLKEKHRREVDDLKEENRQKDWEIKLKEVEAMNENGDQSGWDKVLDKFLNDDFLSNIATHLGVMMQQQGNAQPTKAQIQTAMQNTAQPATQNAGSDKSNPSEARNNPENDSPELEASQSQPEPQTQEEQQMEAKQQIADHLKEMALNTLMGNIEYAEYAEAVRKQLVLNKQHGIQLDAKQWVEMAKMLSEKAIQKELEAPQVAKIIEPALDMLPQKARMMISLIQPKAAANQLFQMYNINVSGSVKNLVIDVLDELLNAKTEKT
jgi:hypothetical protein